MAKKEFTYRGKSIEELQSMDLKELAELFPARIRRKIKRGLTEQNKIFLDKIRKGKKNVETHCRNMIVLPEMIGMTLKIHNGRTFEPLLIQPEMLGHYLGEFAPSRKVVGHSAPGVGATKSSSHLSVR